MIIPKYVVDGQTVESISKLPSYCDVDLEALSLLFTDVSLNGDFQPNSPWKNTTKEWRHSPPSFQGSTVSDLRDVFKHCVASCLGSCPTVAVAFSGGLDSLAVLQQAAKLCQKTDRRCIAITANLRDDSGGDAATTAAQLIDTLQLKCKHIVLDPKSAHSPPTWSFAGPRLEAIPNVARAISDLAAGAGAGVLITGNGADGVLGAPRYLTGPLIRQMKFKAAFQYVLESVRAGRHAVRNEICGFLARLLPRRTRTHLYWATNCPELCDVKIPTVLADRFRDRAHNWQLEWIANRIEEHYLQSSSWAAADAWDSAYPHEVFPAAGLIDERSPFLDSRFIKVALQIPIVERLGSQWSFVYHRQKRLVVELLDSVSLKDLPTHKQIFSSAIRQEEEAPVTADCLIESGLLKGDQIHIAARDPRIRQRVRATENWLCEAITRGYRVAL